MSTAVNDITGDRISSAPTTKYKDNWEKIFGNKRDEPRFEYTEDVVITVMNGLFGHAVTKFNTGSGLATNAIINEMARVGLNKFFDEMLGTSTEPNKEYKLTFRVEYNSVESYSGNQKLLNYDYEMLACNPA